MELGNSNGCLYYMNASIMTVCIWMFPDRYILRQEAMYWLLYYDGIVLLVLLVIIRKMGFYTFIGYTSRKESPILLQLCPPTFFLIARLSLCFSTIYCDIKWIDYSIIPLWFSMYILARFGSPEDNCPFHKMVKETSRVLRGILLVAVVWALPHEYFTMSLLGLFGPLVAGNLQIPMALARIMLSWEWLFMDPTDVHNSRNFNVKIGVKLLYIMVMCQGILYFVACILESLSFLFRRSLALSCGLVDKSGMESIDLYYEQAYVTFLQESLLDTTEKMGLVTFAVDILNHDATQEKKRVAVRILDSFVQKNKTSNSNDTQLVSLITTTTHAVATLISMLGWTVAEDADIRVFAAKITAHLSPHLLIIGIPGTMQKVSSLLDAQDQLITQEISIQIVDGNGGNANDQQITNGSRSPVLDGNRRNIGRQQTRTRNGSSYSPVDIERGNVSAVPGHSRTCKVLLFLMEGIYRFWEHIEKLSSIPHKKSEDNDSLPLLGLQILEGLAHDLYNCAEISRAMELLPKIIGFLNCITGTRVVQRDDITTSSLKLVVKLASIKGQIGITLRQELCDNPFLIGNLAEILELGSNPGYLEQSKFAMDIIGKLAIDKKTRLRTGTVQVIIDKLLQEFIGEDESSKPLQAEAGEALATLSHDSPGNCTAMLDKISYELIEDLAGKLQRGQHVYAAASLLESLCKNSRQLVLSHQDINERLSSTLTVVLEGLKNAEGKQMEALIGLASQICSIMFGNIAHVLDSFPVDVVFVDKLVGELNARKKASPEMRRLLVQLTTSIVESRPRYALIFREHGMVEALSKVEQYMGLVSEEEQALPAMVARAKGLIVSHEST
uniref:BLE2 protein n=1 Tax=Hordeum vulgare subsp. vulgare TaxID=112509 RepID=A0A8I6Z7B4_HORVV